MIHISKAHKPRNRPTVAILDNESSSLTTVDTDYQASSSHYKTFPAQKSPASNKCMKGQFGKSILSSWQETTSWDAKRVYENDRIWRWPLACEENEVIYCTDATLLEWKRSTATSLKFNLFYSCIRTSWKSTRNLITTKNTGRPQPQYTIGPNPCRVNLSSCQSHGSAHTKRALHFFVMARWKNTSCQTPV